MTTPCTAHHITWGQKGHQCLNCGATAAHSWDIKHAPQPKTTRTRNHQAAQQQKRIVYLYRGGTERAAGKCYRWHNGYSENTEAGAITYPWMTHRECQADAKARGAVAEFGTPPGKIPPIEP